jgi:curved DNA-binding protein CbpA
MRAVIAYEAHWERRRERLGPVYRGLRQASLQARIVNVARIFNDMLTPAPGQNPPTADEAIGKLEQEAVEPADRTVIRLLIGALGIFTTGTIVKLDTGETGIVVQTPAHPSLYSQPRVRLVLDPGGAPLAPPIEIDLAHQRACAGEPLHIAEVVATSDDPAGAQMRAYATGPASSSGVRTHRGSLDPPSGQQSYPRTPSSYPPSYPHSTPRARAARTLETPVYGALPKPEGDVLRFAAGDPLTPTGKGPEPMPDDFEELEPLVPEPESADRPVGPATAEGTLQKTPFVHLLIYMLDQRLSGTTVFTLPGGIEHRVYFHDGTPAKVRAGTMLEPLDRVLLDEGMLDEAQLRVTLTEVSKKRVLHGRLLVMNGLLDRQKVMHALRIQVLRKVMHFFELPSDTRYAYYKDQNLLSQYGGPELTPTEPLAVIMAGIRLMAEDPLVDATLRKVGARPLALHLDAETKRMQLTRDEQAVVDLLRTRKMTLDDLLMGGVAQDRVVRLTVYALVMTRQLDLGATRAPVGFGRPPVTDDPVQGPVEGAPPPASAAAPVAPPRRAPPPPPPRAPQASVPIVPAAPIAPAAPVAPAPAAPVEPWVSRRTEIEQRAQSIDGEDFYRMLGVPADATPDQVKSAYFQLAKNWHPDRLPSDLLDLKPLVARVFARFSEAYQTLSDPAKANEYGRTASAGGSGDAEEQERVARVVDAALEFQKAEILLKKNDLAGAERLVAHAFESDPDQPEYRALLAWVRALRRGDPPDMREGQTSAHFDDLIKILDQLLAKEHRFERALYYRGVLLKRSGRVERAIRDFRLAAEINPKNLDAVREVRLYEMRKRTAAGAPKEKRVEGGEGGLFGKFFKR